MSLLSRARLRRAATSLACLTVLLTTAVNTDAVANATNPTVLHVMTYNIYLQPRATYPNWGQMHRADLIAQADFVQNQDVLIFEEDFDPGASDRLFSNLNSTFAYHTPVVGRGLSGWDATTGTYSSASPYNGGVAILSKYPILHQEQHIWDNTCGIEHLSDKGFAYVVLNVNGQRIHVIGMHAQADDSSGCGSNGPNTQRGEFREVRNFINSKAIPANEPIIIGGDTNADKWGSMYPVLLQETGAVEATDFQGVHYTYDPSTDGVTKDNGEGQTQSYTDHLLFAADHAHPATFDNNAMFVKSPTWSVTSWFRKYTYNDYSDHYPVSMTATFN